MNKKSSITCRVLRSKSTDVSEEHVSSVCHLISRCFLPGLSLNLKGRLTFSGLHGVIWLFPSPGKNPGADTEQLELPSWNFQLVKSMWNVGTSEHVVLGPRLRLSTLLRFISNTQARKCIPNLCLLVNVKKECNHYWPACLPSGNETQTGLESLNQYFFHPDVWFPNSSERNSFQ
jgi:hypothetical protein